MAEPGIHWHMAKFCLATPPFGACLVALAASFLDVLLSAPADAGDSLSAAEPIIKKYRIQVVAAERSIREDRGLLTAEPAAEEGIKRYLPLFVSEFSIYPAELVQKCGLRRIVLCSRLAFGRQLRAAVPHFLSNTLYLDVDRGGSQAEYQRAVLHHEFFHLVDYRDDGQLYEDQAWKTLNPRDFRYGAGGKSAQDDPSVSILSEANPGFLNRYAMTGVEEDKAEVFTYLVLRPELMRDRGKRDPILFAKEERMRQLLQSFCPQVNADFWAAVEQKRRAKSKP